jgi:hypothetical protein
MFYYYWFRQHTALLIIDLFVVVVKGHVSAFLPSSGFSCYYIDLFDLEDKNGV